MYKCEKCGFEMNFEAFEIQKGICIKCRKIIEEAKKEIIKELEAYELEHRVNTSCSWYDVQREYDFLIKSLRKRHLSTFQKEKEFNKC